MILSFVVAGILVLLLSIIFMFLALFIVNECNVILFLLGILLGMFFLISGFYFLFQGYYDEEIEFCNIKCDDVGIDKSSYSAYNNICYCKTNIDKTYSNLDTMVVVIE